MKRLYRFPMRSANVGRLVPVLILATLLISMLPAFTPNGAEAQDGSEPTPVAEMQEQQVEGESTEPTETAEPVEPAEPTETAEPQAQGGVTTYLAEARTCPPGFDLSAGDASAALANCVDPLAGVAFSLSSQNPSYPGDTRTTGGDGVAVWPDIPLGTGYTVTAAVPQDSGEPWVYCEVTGGPGADQYRYFPAAGGTMDSGLSDPNLANYAQSYCRWFTVPAADPSLVGTADNNQALGPGEVRITNYLCPVNYNTADMTLGALQAACSSPGVGFTFMLTAGSGGARATTTDAQGTASWTGVPSGNVKIVETMPDGFQFAQPYCSITPVGSAPGAPDLSLVKSDGKTITGNLQAGQALHCSLFNIPNPESTVAIIPFLCPSDFDTADMTLQAVTRGCSIPGLNIEFTITTAEGEQLTGTTGTNGFLEWKNLPSGNVEIAQTTPPGYLAGPTYCDPAPPAGELDGTPWQLPTYENGRILFDIPDRYTLNCVSFYVEGIAPTVVPAGTGSGSVIVQGYICADELYDPAKSLQNYLDLCQTTNEGASVRLFSAESSADLTATISGGAPLSFPDVPPGETELNLLGDSTENRLFCATYLRGEAGPPISNYAEASVIADIEGGSETSCYWFSFQELSDDAYVTITVEKYLCGPEYPDTTAVDDWRAACTNPHPGVTFTAEHIGGPIVTETTGDDSAVTFKVLPGDVYIQATPPDSSAKGYAWCGVGATGAPPAYVNAGRLSAGEPAMPLSNINPELVYSCEWFTVPLEVTSDIADDSGYVTIFKWRCPEHFDSSGKTLEHLLEACPNPQYDVPIAIYYETGTPYIQRTQPEKGTAVARFEDLAPGKVGIGELNPTGNELQRVICSTSVVGQTMFGVVDGSMEYPVADGGIAATIEGGKALTCHFFNVPAEDEDTPPSAGSVSMRKMICPPGFAAVKSSSIDISIYCTYEAYVEFKLTQGETTLSAITGVDGLAKFSGIKAGALRITELPREGYDAPLVFCRTTTVGESAIGELEPVTVDNWGIAYELPEGTYLECVWANMPSSTTSTDPSTILLHAYTCPEGTGPYQLLGTLLTECTVRGEGTAFAAGPPLGKALEFKTNASGDATITNLPAGPNNVFQIEVDGYRPLTAWCDYDPSATSEADDFGRLGADPLSAYMSGGNTLECYWFDVAYVEPVTVTLLKRVCPDDYALVGASREDILFNCTTSPSGVEFRVREDSSTGLQAAAQLYDATLATDATGSAVFYDVPVAPLIISEQSTLYDAVYVYCGQSVSGEPPAIYSELEIANEAVRYEVEPGADVYCYWINVESPPATVIIHKHGCPETAFPKGHDLEDDLAICPVPLVDVTFTVGAAAAELSDVTDVDGLVSFEHVAPGLLFIGETPPAGYTKAIVYCAIQPKGGQQGAFAPVPVTKLAIEQDIVSGDTLECYWFNTKKPFHPDTPSPTPTPGTGKPNTPVPTPGTGKPGTPTPDPDAPATLVLTTYTCPAGYDVYAFEADLAQDCKKVTPGIKVALADLDEDSAGIIPVEIETTDDDGVVIFSELEPGPWLLTEALPETTSTAFVASCTSDQRDLEAEPLFTPLTYLGPDGQIGIVIVAGETLECDSYAIPEETAADDGK